MAPSHNPEHTSPLVDAAKRILSDLELLMTSDATSIRFSEATRREVLAQTRRSREELIDAGIPDKPGELAWLSDDAWHELNWAWDVCALQAPNPVSDLKALAKSLTRRPRGRPVKFEFRWASDVAAERRAGRSWTQIAHKLCPRRGAGHKCDRGCADRVRLRAQATLRKFNRSPL
jgi:hypothetical protein